MFKILSILALLLIELSVALAYADEATDKPMLAKSYHNQNVSGWLASEKLDGVRGYWDGKQMRSKKGNLYHAPKSFINNFPNFALDGELYSSRGQFAKISGIVRSGKDWSQIKYHVFDVPKAAGGLMTRLNKLRTWLKQHPNPNIVIIMQTPIKNIQQAQQMLDDIIKLGGEGIMLHHPTAPYISKRTDTLLKLKKAQDAECVISEHLSGKGKYTGKLGAVVCRMDNGNLIKIGSGFSDAERQNPPPIGSTITYRYNGFSKNGKPRFARFWRVRIKE